MVGDIEKGVFIEDPKVMCYIACIFEMTNVVSFVQLLVIFLFIQT